MLYQCFAQKNYRYIVGLPSVSFCHFYFSICHSFSLFLRFGHATNKLCVETDQDDTEDKVNEDNAEPGIKL